MAVDNPVMEIAALGRPFALGMLYDCQRDALIPGITLWDPEKLSEDTVTRPQPSSTSQVLTSDSMNDKTSSLNISVSLKASFLGGLVEAEGSASFLKDTKKSEHQARVSLIYSQTTHFQQLTMSQVGKHNISYPEAFSEGSATHVVTGIMFGAHAIFVFDQEASYLENVPEVQGQLSFMVKKLLKLSLEGKGEAKLSDIEKAIVEKFTCTFYGDFILKQNPTTYMEAIQTYATLPTLLGNQGEKAVPVKVWLHPLCKLGSKAARLMHEVCPVLISDCEKLLEQMMEVEMKSSDLLQNCPPFPEIQNNIQRFKDLCQQSRQTFQNGLARILPSIRRGGIDHKDLAQLLSIQEWSFAGSKQLGEFLVLKSQEVCLLRFFLNMCKGTDKICSENELKEYVLDPAHDYVVLLTFTSLNVKEPYLLNLRSELDVTSKQGPSFQSIPPWFKDNKILEQVRDAALLFADFPFCAVRKERALFLVTSAADSDCPGAVLHLYRQGQLTGTKLDLLPKPLPPVCERISCKEVQVSFQSRDPEQEEVSGYEVQHRALGQEGWKSEYVEGSKRVFTVTGLSPKAKHEFRYAVATKTGRSPFSDPSEAVQPSRATSPPGKPVLQCHEGHLEASWSSPDCTMRGAVVGEYVVQLQHQLGLFKQIWETRTEGKTENIVLLGINYGCVTRARVKAIYAEGGESGFSGWGVFLP